MAFRLLGRFNEGCSAELFRSALTLFWITGALCAVGEYKNTRFYLTNATIFNDIIDWTQYTTTENASIVECTVRCSLTPGCGHCIFCSDTHKCYLEDVFGAVSCNSGCKKCPCFSEKELTNVALGAVTECSSVYSDYYACDKAVDGLTECTWASRGEGVGNWITIDFGRPRTLIHGRFLQRLRGVERNKDIMLQFSDGSVQQLQLHQTSSFTWDDIQLEPVTTTWVRITTTTVYTNANNGWQEIQLLAWVNKGDVIPLNLPLNYIQSCGL